VGVHCPHCKREKIKNKSVWAGEEESVKGYKSTKQIPLGGEGEKNARNTLMSTRLQKSESSLVSRLAQECFRNGL